MKIKPELQAKFDKFVAFHNQEKYDKMVVDYGRSWANLMEKHLSEGMELSAIFMQDSFTADHWGITGAMNGFAAGMLSRFWIHGDEFRKLYNREMGGTGEEKGAVNPAFVTLGKKESD